MNLYNIWFLCIILTSVTGSVAYGIWKILEKIFKGKKKYEGLFFSIKLTVLFWVIPVIFLYIFFRAKGRDGGWINEAFLVSPVIFVFLKFGLIIWCVGFVWQINNYFKQKYYLSRLKKANILASDEIRNLLEIAKKNYYVKRKVRVYQNISCQIPQVSGVFLPMIIVPKHEWNDKSMEIMIGHEMLHIKHQDLLWKYFLAWLKRIHWFNPLVDLLVNDIEEWNEIHCDRDMCRKENARFQFEEYFDVILKCSSTHARKNNSFLSGTLCEDKRSVERRVLSLKQYKYQNEIKKWGVGLVAVFFVGVVSITSYAAGEGILQGYNTIRENTEVVIEESILDIESLEEEIIPADTNSGVIEIEVPVGFTKASDLLRWNVPVGTLKYTSGFSCKIGEEIETYASVSPDNKKIRVGIIEPDGTRRAVSSTGQIVHTFEVKKNGIHRVYIENQSDVDVDVQFFYNSR